MKYEMLVTESLHWQFFHYVTYNLCWWFSQCINRSSTSWISHQHLKLIINTHLVCNIRHQHQCNPYFSQKRHNCYSKWTTQLLSCPNYVLQWLSKILRIRKFCSNKKNWFFGHILYLCHFPYYLKVLHPNSLLSSKQKTQKSDFTSSYFSEERMNE